MVDVDELEAAGLDELLELAAPDELDPVVLDAEPDVAVLLDELEAAAPDELEPVVLDALEVAALDELPVVVLVAVAVSPVIVMGFGRGAGDS